MSLDNHPQEASEISQYSLKELRQIAKEEKLPLFNKLRQRELKSIMSYLIDEHEDPEKRTGFIISNRKELENHIKELILKRNIYELEYKLSRNRIQYNSISFKNVKNTKFIDLEIDYDSD
jgi:hypothetical protein